MADGNVEACDLLTPNGDDEARITGGGSSCAESITEQMRYVRFNFLGIRPEDLTAELDSGQIEHSGDGSTKFFLCTPSETKVRLALVESDSGWQIDSVSGSKRTFVKPNGDKVPEHRRLVMIG